MALLTVSGRPAARWEDVAREAAHLLAFELVTESRLDQWMVEEFGEISIPDAAWRAAAVSILARIAAGHSLVIALPEAELLFAPGTRALRVNVTAPDAVRTGNLMLDRRIENTEAHNLLVALDAEAHRRRKARFGRLQAPPGDFDLVLNTARMAPDAIAEIVRAAAIAHGLPDDGPLAAADAAEIQFQSRLQLARHHIVPAGRANLRHAEFSHPSEEMFANLLDFYRIPWEYEPRSFPLQWDKDGKVTEAFTPDFYLPEFDLYVELTTMKQSLVTRKNRKVKLLRAIYPHIHIQVFYQKDFQALVFKYGFRVAAS